MSGEVANVMTLKTATTTDTRKMNKGEKNNSRDFKNTFDQVRSKKEEGESFKSERSVKKEATVTKKDSNNASKITKKEENKVSNSELESDASQVDQQTLKKVKDLLEKLGIEVSDEILSQIAMKFNFDTIIDTLSTMEFMNDKALDLSSLLKTMESIVDNLENMKSFLMNQSVPELSKNEIKMKFDHLLNQLNGKVQSVEVSATNKDTKESIKELMTFIKDTLVTLDQSKNQSKTTTERDPLVNQSEIVGNDQLIRENEESKFDESDVKVMKEEKIDDTDTKKVSANELKSDEVLLKSQVKEPGLLTNEKGVIIKEETQVNFKEELNFRLLSKSQQSAKVFDQIKETFTTKFDGKISEMKVMLDPKSLGKVELKLTIEKGNVLAEFEVQSTTVKQAIESNLQDLRNALSEKGYSLEGLDVSVNQENQEESDQNQQYYENIFEESDDEDNDSIALIEESKMLNILNRRAISYLG